MNFNQIKLWKHMTLQYEEKIILYKLYREREKELSRNLMHKLIFKHWLLLLLSLFLLIIFTIITTIAQIATKIFGNYHLKQLDFSFQNLLSVEWTFTTFPLATLLTSDSKLQFITWTLGSILFIDFPLINKVLNLLL